MHKKYSNDGVVCISVSIDEPRDKDKDLAFLKKVNATTANYLLDDEDAEWKKKLNADAPPTVFVYGRDGRLVKKFTSGHIYEQVEKEVQALLKK